jgi:uncharacterized protein YkwD
MIVLDVSHQGRTRRITTDRETISIGRGRSCALRTSESGVAEKHCTLTLESTKRPGRRGKKWQLSLQDHQVSDVPTLVNGVEVIKTRLTPGDVVQVGDLRLGVVTVGGGSGQPTRAQDPANQGAAPRTGEPGAARNGNDLTPADPVSRPANATLSRSTDATAGIRGASTGAPRPRPVAISRPPTAPGPVLPATPWEPTFRRRASTRRAPAVNAGAASRGGHRILSWTLGGMAAAVLVIVGLLALQGENARSNRDQLNRGPDGTVTRSAKDLRVYPDPSPTAGAQGPRFGSAHKSEGGVETSATEASESALDPVGESAAAPPDRRPPPARPDAVVPAPTHPGPTTARLGKRAIYLEALKADRLARSNEFSEAAEHYRALVSRTDVSRLKAELNDRLVDLERLARAREELASRLADPGANRPHIVAQGSRVQVLGVRRDQGIDQGIVVDLSGEVMLPWRTVSPRGMAALFTWAFPGAEGQILRGLYLFEFKADFEKDRDLENRCHASFKRALSLEPSRIQEVNAILGRGLGVASPTGFVFHDHRFMTPERRDRLTALAEAEKQMKNLSSGKAEVRRSAYDYLRGVNDLETFRLFRQVLEARRRVLGKQLGASSTGKKIAALRAMKVKFLEKRKAAMDMIFDTVNYPYPFRPGRGATQEDYQRYLASQDKIDDLTRELWKIWKSTKGQVAIGKTFVRDYAVLHEVQTELDKFKHDEVEPAAGLEWIVALGDLSFFKEKFRNKITLATLPMDETERALIEYNHRVMAYNAALETPATKAEREQVAVTNRYRNLMGRRALMLNNKLLASARGHSRDMVLKGYFSHHAPDPERRTPRQRMKLAGYDLKGGSENIARGASGPEAVHERWRHSSGHHRNLLGKSWLELGSGNVGSLWTQNFGTRGLDLDQVLAKESGQAQAPKEEESRARDPAGRMR